MMWTNKNNVLCSKCEGGGDGKGYEIIDLCNDCFNQWTFVKNNGLDPGRFWWRLYMWCNQIPYDMYNNLENLSRRPLEEGGMDENGLNRWGGYYPEEIDCLNCEQCVSDIGNQYYCANCTVSVYNYTNPDTNSISFGFNEHTGQEVKNINGYISYLRQNEIQEDKIEAYKNDFFQR